MKRFLARRFMTFVFTLLGVSVIIFTLSRLQGDPRLLYLSADTTIEQYEAWGR